MNQTKAHAAGEAVFPVRQVQKGTSALAGRAAEPMAAARAGWVRDEVVGDGDKLPGQPLRRGNAEDLARDDEAVRHTVFADKVKPELSGGPAEHAEGRIGQRERGRTEDGGTVEHVANGFHWGTAAGLGGGHVLALTKGKCLES